MSVTTVLALAVAVRLAGVLALGDLVLLLRLLALRLLALAWVVRVWRDAVACRAFVAPGAALDAVLAATVLGARAPVERELINLREPFSLISTVCTWGLRMTSR